MVHLHHLHRPHFHHRDSSSSSDEERETKKEEATAKANSSELQDALESLVEDPNAPGKDKEKTELDAHAFMDDDEEAGEHRQEGGDDIAAPSMAAKGHEEGARKDKGKGGRWLRKFFSEESIDQLFAHNHMGNYVYIRSTGAEIFESVPIYVRLGMHLLFVDASQVLSHERASDMLTDLSIKQGKVYDATGPGVLPHIQAFVDQFDLNLDELLEPDLTKYRTFNDFFSRKLNPAARPIASPHDDQIIVSQSDCRLTVWDSADDATSFWIKGKEFTIASLLGSADLASTLGAQPSLAIFRLAPQDYHRYHSPVTGVVGEVRKIPGTLYTVNPQAINTPLSVFTSNQRWILPITLPSSNKTIYICAIGAMLVGSNTFSPSVRPGETVQKGDELGWFSYGGSTVIAVLPEGMCEWDQDLREKSKQGMEVLVKVGEQIGRLKV